MDMPLPTWVDREAWDGFVTMRKTMKRPLTERAAKLILAELYRIKDAGHDPNSSLDQSTVNCWQDVYPPREKQIYRATGSSAYAATQDLLKQMREHAESATPPPAEFKARGSKLRRVS